MQVRPATNARVGLSAAAPWLAHHQEFSTSPCPRPVRCTIVRPSRWLERVACRTGQQCIGRRRRWPTGGRRPGAIYQTPPSIMYRYSPVGIPQHTCASPSPRTSAVEGEKAEQQVPIADPTRQMATTHCAMARLRRALAMRHASRPWPLSARQEHHSSRRRRSPRTFPSSGHWRLSASRSGPSRPS